MRMTGLGQNRTQTRALIYVRCWGKNGSRQARATDVVPIAVTHGLVRHASGIPDSRNSDSSFRIHKPSPSSGLLCSTGELPCFDLRPNEFSPVASLSTGHFFGVHGRVTDAWTPILRASSLCPFSIITPVRVLLLLLDIQRMLTKTTGPKVLGLALLIGSYLGLSQPRAK